jgi:hypothetical protein
MCTYRVHFHPPHTYLKRPPESKSNFEVIEMGRTFESVRQGVNHIADRWARSSRYMRPEDRKYGEKLAKLAKMHSSEAFVGCDDALEAVVFSVLIEVIKIQENRGYLPEIVDGEYPDDGVLSLKHWT